MILNSFDESNEKALELMEDKFDINKRMMDRRVDEICEFANDYMEKNKKIS